MANKKQFSGAKYSALPTEHIHLAGLDLSAGHNAEASTHMGAKILTRSRNAFILALILLTAAVLLIVVSSVPSSKAKLLLAEDSSFHISAFSDLHYGENEDDFGIDQDRKSTALMRQILSQERPDFAVLNGDLITGENTFAHNASDYVDRIVAPLVEGNFKWASTYGNHDSKFNLSRDALYAKEKQYPGAYTQHGPASTDGVSNYVLPIFQQRSTKKPVALLWFFDSRGGSKYQSLPANVDNIDDSVSNRTARWFRAAQAKMQSRYGALPSLAFVHIPFIAFLELQAQSASPAVSGPQYPGLDDDKPLAHQGYSNTGAEAVPFMQALLDTPGLHSIYSGHDHGDSWCGRWPDTNLPGYGVGGGSSLRRPFLCFCKHSGYGGYGHWNRGVRQIRMTFDEDTSIHVDTWVRMQSGEIVTAVTLNETYGEDVYDTADGGYRDGQAEQSM